MRRLSSTLLFVLASGCASSSQYDYYVATAAQRASFDLGCDASQVQITVMATGPSIYGPLPTQAGATGCGQRALYVMDVRTGNWILNSVVQPQPQPQPAPASATQPTTTTEPGTTPPGLKPIE